MARLWFSSKKGRGYRGDLCMSSVFGLDAKKIFGLILAAILVCGVVFVATNSVSKRLTQEDLTAISVFELDEKCAEINSFEDELGCAKAAQASIHRVIPNTECAAPGQTVEPMEFLKRGFGCCTDRTRTLEKIFTHYGLVTRKVALYDISALGLFKTMITPGVDSHATLEVMTKRGWMGVDSNHEFVLFDEERGPYSYTYFSREDAEVEASIVPYRFYSNKPIVIFGLYSRHGYFHGPNVPGPEVNIHDFLRYNLFG